MPQLLLEKLLELSRRVSRLYLQQLFIENFVVIVVLAKSLASSKWNRFTEPAKQNKTKNGFSKISSNEVVLGPDVAVKTLERPLNRSKLKISPLIAY